MRKSSGRMTISTELGDHPTITTASKRLPLNSTVVLNHGSWQMLDSPIKVATKMVDRLIIEVHRCSRLDNHVIHNENPVTHGKAWSWVTKVKMKSPIVVAVRSSYCMSLNPALTGSSNKTTRGWLMMARAIFCWRCPQYEFGTLLVTFQLNHLENFRCVVRFLCLSILRKRSGKGNIFQTHSYVETR